jgi:hypothetical protein
VRGFKEVSIEMGGRTARGRVRAGGHNDDAVRHVRAQRDRPLPFGARRHRPRAQARQVSALVIFTPLTARARTQRRPRGAGAAREAERAQGIRARARRRHARGAQLEVGRHARRVNLCICVTARASLQIFVAQCVQ